MIALTLVTHSNDSLANFVPIYFIAQPGQYPHGMRSVIKEMIKRGEPASALLKGLTPAVIRSIPGTAVCQKDFNQALNLSLHLQQNSLHSDKRQCLWFSRYTNRLIYNFFSGF